MHSAKVAIASTALSLWAFSAGAVTVTPTDAMGQVGHTAKVCGVVASAFTRQIPVPTQRFSPYSTRIIQMRAGR